MTGRLLAGLPVKAVNLFLDAVETSL